MSKPQAYEPCRGYKWQLLCRSGRTWEHCDYAVNRADLRHLLAEYRLAYGPGFEIKAYRTPAYCWPGNEHKPAPGPWRPILGPYESA